MTLKEYRCACGKLLFKGLLCQCVVETKCRRCGVVSTWGIDEALSYTLIESDAQAFMTEASGDVINLLGCGRDQLVGRPITDLFPLLRDAPSDNTGSAYQFKEMPLMLRDGRERIVESCVVPRYKDGAFDGYRVFSVSKPSSLA